jgi:hypothetical protein
VLVRSNFALELVVLEAERPLVDGRVFADPGRNIDGGVRRPISFETSLVQLLKQWTFIENVPPLGEDRGALVLSLERQGG